MLVYSGPSGWISATIVLPNLGHYRTLADEIAATFKAPESDLDRLLRKAHEDKFVVYRGKRTKYSYRLRAIWKPHDLAKDLDKMGDAKKAIEEIGIEGVEYTFNLGDGHFGNVNAEVGDVAIDFADLKGHAAEVLQALQQVVEAVAPGFQVRVTFDGDEILKRDGLTWGELKFHVFMTKGNYRSEFRIIQRVANHQGKSFAFSGRVQRNHPGSRRWSVRRWIPYGSATDFAINPRRDEMRVPFLRRRAAGEPPCDGRPCCMSSISMSSDSSSR